MHSNVDSIRSASNREKYALHAVGSTEQHQEALPASATARWSSTSTLFVGDIARPDLAVDKQEGADLLVLTTSHATWSSDLDVAREGA